MNQDRYIRVKGGRGVLPEIGNQLGRCLFFCLLIGQGISSTVLGQPIELRVQDEMAPPGGTAMILVELTEPEPISGGRTRVRYSRVSLFQSQTAQPSQQDILGKAVKVDLLSSTDDVFGTSVIGQNEVSVEMTSPGGTFGTELDLPILAIAVPVSPTALPGTSLSIELDLGASNFANLGGEPYALSVDQGVFTVGGVSISEILPERGLVTGGSTIVLRGVGFQPGADVNIEGADVDTITFLNSTELHVTLEQSFEFFNTTRIRLRNPDQTEDVFYPINSRPATGGTAESVEFLVNELSLVRETAEDLTVNLVVAGSRQLELTSSDPAIVRVPGEIPVDPASKSVKFRVFGRQSGTASITAKLGSSAATVNLTVSDGTLLKIPVLRSDGDPRLGLALTSRQTDPATLRFRAYPDDSSGSNYFDSFVQLEGLNQKALFLGEWSDLLNGFSGWLEVSTLSSGIFGQFIYVPDQIVRYPGSVGGAPGLMRFALFFSAFDPLGEQELALINNNPDEATVQIDWLGDDGEMLGQKLRSLLPQSSLQVDLSQLLEISPDSLSGTYARVQSSQPLTAYQQMSALPFIHGAGPNREVQSGSLAVPHVAAGFGWETEIQIANTGSTANAIGLRLVQDSGDFRELERINLAPGQLQRLSLTEAFQVRPGELLIGSILISTDGPTSASAFYGRKSGIGVVTVLPVLSRPVRSAVLAQVANGEIGGLELFTGLALQNTGDVEAEISLEVRSSEGVLNGTGTVHLDPGERLSRLLSELVENLPPQLGGHVFVSSSAPVYLVQIFGDEKLTFVSTVTASEGRE